MKKETMGKDVFEMAAEYFINERLEDILMQDGRFAGLQRQIWEQMKKLEMSGRDMQQSLAVEGLVSLHIKNTDFYALKAYEYGFRDCISVLRKLELIR